MHETIAKVQGYCKHDVQMIRRKAVRGSGGVNVQSREKVLLKECAVDILDPDVQHMKLLSFPFLPSSDDIWH